MTPYVRHGHNPNTERTSMETGWLIDDTKNQLCLAANGLCFFWTPYTSESALRFARRQDACLVFTTLGHLTGQPWPASVDVVDHAWCPA